jgi:penicillin amidase
MTSKRLSVLLCLGITLNLMGWLTVTPAHADDAGEVLETFAVGNATVERMVNNIPRITADNDYDAIFANGYMHAMDRLFQMDLTRRQASGTLAEVLGDGALGADVQMRTLGLRRAAQASLPAVSAESQLWLQAYADGVNAYVADTANPMPPEYGALELTRESFTPWTPIDSVAVAKLLAFGLSFDLGDIDRTIALLTFQVAGEIVGFDGTALFFEDLYRTAPFDPSITTPGWFGSGKTAGTAKAVPRSRELPAYLNEKSLRLLQSYRATAAEVPMLRTALERRDAPVGSNWWVTAGALTESGFPIIANDPHLALDTPATFYEIQLRVTDPDGPMDVFGVSFPGAPLVAQGCTPKVCWGSTVFPLDVTDVYIERLAVNINPILSGGGSPLPIATYFDGHWEPILHIKEKYFVNQLGDGTPDNLVAGPGGTTFIVPRRNYGPIVDYDPSDPYNIVGVSVQYTGWGATREVDCFRIWARAENLDDYQEGLQYFDIGAQNWSYADVDGNIAYFDSAELPLREDLQNLNYPDGGVPPYFLRDGTHQLMHEWLPVSTPQPGQAVPYEILPQDEMPHEINPERGFILNANNDPVGVSLDNNPLNQLRAGGGLYYLNPGFATGFRIGRIQSLYDDALAAGELLTVDDIMRFQANNQLLDAEVFAPMIVAAFDAMVGGKARTVEEFNPNLPAAIEYLRNWDFSTPTGIAAGYDPFDDPTNLPAPSQDEINASIAATIYSVWRGQIVQLVIDTPLVMMGIGSTAPGSSNAMSALRNLIDNIDTNGGYGASGIPFIPGGDVGGVMLFSLSEALDLLASDAFFDAFGNSTELDDYRWGYLHRIVFDHPLGPPFSIPPSGGLTHVSESLMGVARSGGMGAVDASSHSARADSVNRFMFGAGPNRRFVGHMTPDGIELHQTTPGGTSGVIGSPHQSDSLMLWLTNRYLERLHGGDDGE